MNLESFSLDAITRRRPLVANTNEATTPSSCHADPLVASDTEGTLTLKRSLRLLDLIFYGVGCSVGAGIYSLIGVGAQLAGPSIALSFGACGVACCFTSLCYAEFAAAVPLAGSAYTFTYVSFGELCGWLVGWNLTLGYAVSAAVVARSWAEYLVGFVQGFLFVDASTSASSGINPYEYYLTKYPLPILGEDYTCCPLSMLIVGLCTVVLVTGVKESARFNSAMTILNLAVLAFVLVAGIGSGTAHVDNLRPFFSHGMMGMARGAGLVFFSYLGFDMVACLSEEVENPQVTLPIGIIGSLLVSMTIYVSVSLVVIAMAPAEILGQDVPIVNALLAAACCQQDEMAEIANTCLAYNECQPILHPLLYHGSRFISFGAIFGLTTATFACLMGQPRIFYSMAQDGLLFPFYAKVHPQTGVPTIGTILTGIGTAIVACLVDLESLANTISLGTLQVFTFVCAGIILLRTRHDTVSGSVQDVGVAGESSPLLNVASGTTATVPAELLTSTSTKPPTRVTSVARWLGIHVEPSLSIRESLRKSHPLTVSENGAKPVWLVLLFTVTSTVASYALSNEWPTWILTGCGLAIIVSAALLFRLPQSPPPETFACPSVPLLPLLGIVFNCYMMGSMPSGTWLIIGIWLLAGLVFYLLYGIHNSKLRMVGEKRLTRNETTANSATP